MVVCLVYGAFALTANGWGPLLTPLATQLSFSVAQVGLLFVAWSIGYLPGTLFGGTLLDGYGPRLVFLIALLVLVAGMVSVFCLVLFHLASLSALILGAGIAGLGGGILDAATNGFISNLYPESRGSALNRFTALYPLSAMLIALIDGGFLWLSHNDPRSSLLFPIGFSLVAFLGVFLFFPPHMRKKRERLQEKHSSWFPSSRFNRRIFPLLLLMSLAILLTTGFTATVRTWTPTYLHLTYGQVPAFAAILSGIMNGIVFVARLLISLIVDRIGTRLTIVLGISVAALGFLLALLNTSVAWIGLGALTMAAIGLTPLVATFMALGNERLGQFSGMITGVILFVAGISNSLWSGLFGVVLAQAGSRWAIVLCLVPLICGIIMLLSIPRTTKIEKGMLEKASPL